MRGFFSLQILSYLHVFDGRKASRFSPLHARNVGIRVRAAMPRRTQQAIGAPAPRVFVPAGGGKASLQVVCNPGRLSRYASPAEAQHNKSLRLEVEVHSAPP